MLKLSSFCRTYHCLASTHAVSQQNHVSISVWIHWTGLPTYEEFGIPLFPSSEMNNMYVRARTACTGGSGSPADRPRCPGHEAADHRGDAFRYSAAPRPGDGGDSLRRGKKAIRRSEMQTRRVGEESQKTDCEC